MINKSPLFWLFDAFNWFKTLYFPKKKDNWAEIDRKWKEFVKNNKGLYEIKFSKEKIKNFKIIKKSNSNEPKILKIKT